MLGVSCLYFVASLMAGFASSEECVCVPFYQCSDDNKVLVHGSVDIIDTRIPIDDNCRDTEVCCNLPDNETISAATHPENDSEFVSIVSSSPPAFHSDPHNDDSFILVPSRPDGMTGCGVKRVTPLDTRIPKTAMNRIITPSRIPENTFFGEFPWMVGLFSKTEKGEHFLCGASVIDPWVVLTAAHCLIPVFDDLDKLIVVAGDWNAVEDIEPISPQRRKAGSMVVHEGFNRGNLINDIALIFLEKELFLSESVDNICVSETNFEPSECFATGWGVEDIDEDSTLKPILKKVSLPIVDNFSCEEKLRDTRLGKYFKLHPSFICAGGIINTDTCKGDGGGPLICSEKDGNPNRFAQVGIVSWGIDCGSDVPGVYTSVYYFYEWIKDHLSTFSKSGGGRHKLGGSN